MGILLSQSDAIATITLDRQEALNALTPSLLSELADTLDTVANDPSVRVVVLTGAGRAFSAGVDLKALAEEPPEDGDVSGALNNPAREACDALSQMPKVTIARVNGFCFAGALELALACDLMVTAEEAKLGDTHAKWGLRPTWGMSARLMRAVGPVRARELSYTARTFTGREAYEFGIASHCVPLDDLDVTVLELATAISANSPESIAAYKDLYLNQQQVGVIDGLSFEYSTMYPMGDAGGRLDGFGKNS
ncbi:MAG: enoyl-CoA hydratase/isomerase family protein [Ilumatobacteraceae bacterium]